VSYLLFNAETYLITWLISCHVISHRLEMCMFTSISNKYSFRGSQYFMQSSVLSWNSTHLMAGMNKVPCWVLISIRCCCTKFSLLGELVPAICTPLHSILQYLLCCEISLLPTSLTGLRCRIVKVMWRKRPTRCHKSDVYSQFKLSFMTILATHGHVNVKFRSDTCRVLTRPYKICNSSFVRGRILNIAFLII
jgi:hypothetical protein